MAFIPALNTAKVTVWQVLFGQYISNTLHVQGPGAWSESSLTDLGNAVIEAWNAHVGPLQTNECQYSHVSLRDMTTAEGFGMELAFPALSGGDRLGGGVPGNVAIACKLITNFSGRNRRGRLFLGGITEDQIDGNELTALAHTQIETNMRSLVQDINDGVGDVVIASYYDGMALEENSRGETVWTPQPRVTALLTPVTNVVVDKFGDSMRRRLQGRGN